MVGNKKENHRPDPSSFQLARPHVVGFFLYGHDSINPANDGDSSSYIHHMAAEKQYAS